MIKIRVVLIAKTLFILIAVILLTACSGKSIDGMLIVTEALSSQVKPDFVTGNSWRYVSQSRLLLIDPQHPDKAPELITSDFFSARSPEISYDGNFLLFAAQQYQNDPWQIWEMELRNLKFRQVTSSSDNSIDPAYLPGGRVVFCRLSQNDSLRAGHTLYTCNLDGTDLRRITFNPHTYFAPSVLKDGRVITISRQVYPSHNDPGIMVLRPDGTKAELFYKGNEGSELISRGWETSDGKIMFIESENNSSAGGKLVSISYNRPLHTRMDLSQSLEGDFRSVFPMIDGRTLVSYRSSEKDLYSLYEFDSGNKTLGNKLYSSTIGNIIEAVAVYKHERPRKLPSEVDMGVKTGLLLCQNINVTGMNSPEAGFSLPLADRIEVIGVDSSLGVVEVEKDGSVYLKVAADMPFRIRTLDKTGKVVNGPGGWYYLRPNERRGCIGCHEDREMVPANRYAVAVSKNPVTVPVHYDGIIEKEVELE
jgi:hypothetical protein